MQTEALDSVYGTLAAALGRIGERDAALFLATLALDLIAREDDAAFVTAAIARAERLARRGDDDGQGR